jgi:hypothetical protein
MILFMLCHLLESKRAFRINPALAPVVRADNVSNSSTIAARDEEPGTRDDAGQVGDRRGDG